MYNVGPPDGQQVSREKPEALIHSPQGMESKRVSQRRPAVGLSRKTVHVKATFYLFLGSRSLTILLSQGLVNEVCSPFKVSTEVELLCVIGLDAQVGDAGVLVEVGIGVDMHEGPALSSIQDMSDAQFLQLGDVLSHRPGEETAAGYD